MTYLTANEVAQRLQITPARVYELARQGIIPCVSLGRQKRFEEGQLQQWANEGGTALPGGWRRVSLPK